MDEEDSRNQKVIIPTEEEIEKIAILMWKVIVHIKSPVTLLNPNVFTLPFSSLRSIDGIHCRGFIRASFHRRDSRKLIFQYSFKSFVANTNGCCQDETCKDDNTYTYYEKTETLECTYAKVLAYLTNIFTNEIPSLKYNCLTSSFEHKNLLELNNSLGKMLGQMPNVTVHNELCCVCLEVTKFMTSCNHSICPPCLDRIIIAAYTGCSHAETKCPICRTPVTDGNLIIRE